jgi:hypothetical protein
MLRVRTTCTKTETSVRQTAKEGRKEFKRGKMKTRGEGEPYFSSSSSSCNGIQSIQFNQYLLQNENPHGCLLPSSSITSHPWISDRSQHSLNTLIGVFLLFFFQPVNSADS